MIIFFVYNIYTRTQQKKDFVAFRPQKGYKRLQKALNSNNFVFSVLERVQGRRGRKMDFWEGDPLSEKFSPQSNNIKVS